MSAKYQTVSFADFPKARVTCQAANCGVTVEFPFNKLADYGHSCHKCKEPFNQVTGTGVIDALKLLAGNLALLENLKHKFTLEFVLPDDEESA